MAYCIMCGKEHTGDYHVCNACIAKYNLTDEQLMDMGGLRDKTEDSKNISFKENTIKSSQISTKTKKETTQTNTKDLNALIISMIVLACIIASGLLIVCFRPINKSNDESKKIQPHNYDSSGETPVSKEENTALPTKDTSTPTPTKKPEKKVKGTKLFEDVYVPFATREKSPQFYRVENFVKGKNYKCKIKKQTKKELGEITVTASNGDYVYFAFYEAEDLYANFEVDKDDIIVIMSVSYYQKKSKKQVSLDNYSSDNSYEYDTYRISSYNKKSGYSDKEVSSVEKQRNFLFEK